jgi:gliding motility-associated-like protein
VNGQWTIIVQDNLGIDDGYIFEWGLFFDPSLFPGSSSYQNYVVSEEWSNDPTIVSGQNDTLLTVQPDTPGNYGYTYNVIDDFGCAYDTTVFLYVLGQPEIQDDTLACFYGVQLGGTESYQGGTWSSLDTAITYLPSNDVENPFVSTSTPGVYTLTYTDLACNSSVDVLVNFPPYVWADIQDTVLCQGVEYVLLVGNEPSVNQWNWTNGASGQSIIVTEPGIYEVEASNICHSATATAVIGYKICDIVAPNVISLSSMVGNDIWFVQANGLATFNCQITNRWGNLIYEYSDPNGGWDGRNQNGKEVSHGTYFYIIVATIEGGEVLQKHGFIEVVQ